MVRDEASPTVRPYVITGGRVDVVGELPMETLVTALPDAMTVHTLQTEMRTILTLTSDRYMSVAEVSAHSHLPLGVVRVLIADLARDGMLAVHASTGRGEVSRQANSDLTLSLLESVVDGISVL